MSFANNQTFPAFLAISSRHLRKSLGLLDTQSRHIFKPKNPRQSAPLVSDFRCLLRAFKSRFSFRELPSSLIHSFAKRAPKSSDNSMVKTLVTSQLPSPHVCQDYHNKWLVTNIEFIKQILWVIPISWGVPSSTNASHHYDCSVYV